MSDPVDELIEAARGLVSKDLVGSWNSYEVLGRLRAALSRVEAAKPVRDAEREYLEAVYAIEALEPEDFMFARSHHELMLQSTRALAALLAARAGEGK